MTYALTLSGHSVHRPGPKEGRTVCGYQIHTVHDIRPDGPACVRCAVGVCPDCGGTVQLRSDGMLGQHKQWIVGAGGVSRRGGRWCHGAGLEPERDDVEVSS